MSVEQAVASHVATFGRNGPGSGRPVPIPPGADPGTWAEFAAQVVTVDGGCHLWMGRLQGTTGYGEFRYRTAEGIRITGAHRYSGAVFIDLPTRPRPRRRPPPQDSVLPLPGLPDPPPVAEDDDAEAAADVRHWCDEPLCAPVTAEAAAVHLIPGDAWDNAHDRNSRGRAGSRRHGVVRLGAHIGHRMERALALQRGVNTALACGIGTDGLLAVVDEIDRDGDPMRDQGSLIAVPSRRLRVVR